MQKEYCEGYQAFFQKQWLNNCPYSDSEKKSSWQRGWQDANHDPSQKSVSHVRGTKEN